MNIRQIAGSLPMSPARYVALYALPAILGSAIAIWMLLEVLGPVIDPSSAAALWSIPFLVFVAAVAYPVAAAQGKRQSINNSIHLFITHMGVLATSNLGRVEVFRALSKKKEYGALAEEVHKISELVRRWNMGLSEACRFTAKRSPSRIFADFLDRFAYSLDAGEDFEVFLRHEQTIVMEEYAALYRGRLYEVENLKGVFMSLIMSVVFMIIFILILPMLVGTSPAPLVIGAVGVVILVETFFVFLAKAKAPRDPLWFSDSDETRLHKVILWTLPVSLVGVLVVTGITLAFFHPPEALVVAIGVSPLIVTGYAVAREEAKLKRRDDNFGAFIRSLGASASSRGGAVREVLRTLRDHDFGPLTGDIRSLHHRLNLQVDDAKAWHLFAAESGSNLIDKFSAMFVEGVKSGGKPDAIGQLLSENFIRIIGLRKHRQQVADGFRGLLYGLTGGVALSLAIGYGVLKMVLGIFSALPIPEDIVFITPISASSVPLATISFAILLVLLVHAASSSILIRIATGGNQFAGWVDFVGMTWVAAIATVVATRGLETLLGVAAG